MVYLYIFLYITINLCYGKYKFILTSIHHNMDHSSLLSLLMCDFPLQQWETWFHLIVQLLGHLIVLFLDTCRVVSELLRLNHMGINFITYSIIHMYSFFCLQLRLHLLPKLLRSAYFISLHSISQCLKTGVIWLS